MTNYIKKNFLFEEVVDEVINMPAGLSVKVQSVVFAAVCFLSIIVPFGFGHPQWLIGTIVNAILFLAVIFLPKKYWLPLIVFPSLGVLTRGLILGPVTFFLIYFLPFVWLGNWILMLVFEKMFISRVVGNDTVRYLFAVLLAGLSKFLFLFVTANLYFNLKVVPKIFVVSMGLNQLGTALAGGVISLLIYKAFKNYKIIKN